MGEKRRKKMRKMRAIMMAMLLLSAAALSGGCDWDIAVGGVPYASAPVYDVYVPAPVVYPVYYDPCYYGCGDYVEVWYKQR